MENSDDPDRAFDAWHSWPEHRRSSQENDHNEEIPGLPEWWELETERFDGAWLIDDGCHSRKTRVLAASIVRLLVLQTALRCIRRETRGEDVIELLETTRAYMAQLRTPARERKRLERVLSALHPFDPVAATDALLAAAWSAQQAKLHDSAQSLLTAAYESARRFGLHEAAAAVADAFAGMARMHECHRAARKWRGRAFVHARRAARCYRS